MSLDQPYWKIPLYFNNMNSLKMATSIDPDILETPYSGSYSSFQESLSLERNIIYQISNSDVSSRFVFVQRIPILDSGRHLDNKHRIILY